MAYMGTQEILQLAERAGINPDTPALKFTHGQSYHNTDADGGYGVHDWYRITAAGKVVREYGLDSRDSFYYSSGPGIYVSGPWQDDIEARLKEVQAEAEAILEKRRKRQAAADKRAAKAKEKKDREAKAAWEADYQRLKDAN